MDVCDESTLKHKAQEAGMPTENIPNKIDFVIPNGNWDIVTERFDCIFSANLVEHQPDIVKHLQDISKHLYRGGVYIVYIPDKRYCFDHYFPVSTLEDVLAAHFEKRNNHCFTDLLRTYMHTHCDCSMHWQGNHGRQQVLSREQYEQLSSRYRMSLASGEYMDAHAWFFVPEAFFQIVEQLREMDFIDLRIECFYPTGYMESGFVACLKKDRK